jgi:hypothetical protein
MDDQPRRTFSPDDLAILSAALKDAIRIKVDGAVITEGEMQKLSTRLGKIIMDHFTAGETDPEVLKMIAINSISGLA